MDQAIIGHVEDIIALLAGMAGGDGLSSLTQSLPGVSSELYSWAMAIAENVMMPVAMSVLALFCMLELHKQATRANGAGAGEAFAAEIVFRTLFKTALCKEILGNAPRLMEGIYNASTQVTHAVMGEAKISAVALSASASALKPAIDDMDLYSKLALLLTCLIIKLVAWAAVLLANTIILGRFAEIMLMLCLSPIPLATFPNEEMGQIGKSFIKGFCALCTQGATVYLSLSFFPMVANPILASVADIGTVGDLNSALGKLLMCSMLLIGMLTSSRKFANTVFGLGG